MTHTLLDKVIKHSPKKLPPLRGLREDRAAVHWRWWNRGTYEGYGDPPRHAYIIPDATRRHGRFILSAAEVPT